MACQQSPICKECVCVCVRDVCAWLLIKRIPCGNLEQGFQNTHQKQAGRQTAGGAIAAEGIPLGQLQPWGLLAAVSLLNCLCCMALQVRHSLYGCTNVAEANIHAWGWCQGQLSCGEGMGTGSYTGARFQLILLSYRRHSVCPMQFLLLLHPFAGYRGAAACSVQP